MHGGPGAPYPPPGAPHGMHIAWHHSPGTWPQHPPPPGAGWPEGPPGGPGHDMAGPGPAFERRPAPDLEQPPAKRQHMEPPQFHRRPPAPPADAERQ
jgi:hypothetical protein